MLRFRTDVNFSEAIRHNDEFLMPLARVEGLLRDRNIVFSRTEGDVTFADTNHGPPSAGGPVVLFDRSDGAFLWWRFQPEGRIVRELLESPDTLGLIKISRYRSRAEYNVGRTDVSGHAERIRVARGGGELEGARVPVEPISDQAFSRLHLGAGFWAFDQCEPLAQQPGRDGCRPIDVFCAVSVNYRCPTISWHRQTALDCLNALPNLKKMLARGRVIGEHEYRELIRQTRICVSPWGWGETCIRDYEALLAGCVLIKPRTDFIDSALPLDERHYVACKPDFSDLDLRIQEVLDQWPHYVARAEALREYVLRARNPEAIADQYAAALMASVASPVGKVDSVETGLVGILPAAT